MSLVKIGVITLFLAIPVTYFSWALFKLKQSSPKIRQAWLTIGSFNQYLIKMGFVLLIPVPYLKGLPERDVYAVAFITELLPAVATGFFVGGLIAYSKAMHEINEKGT
ncbi:hypothetical protein [Chromohalobacter nigrandesensis]|uniref:hypothetical protein n=1 Tax=Chromohalobacter nigrandesensis TaxID=119863 RepID=UPI001FF51D8C|nr:hypothetical protein [Chromohalobacter nigrandesensis]MCK0746343.1 hypothetical protein [Chromohalobacter nigrandesensis]